MAEPRRASPERFQAAVKRAFKDEPANVVLVRIVDDGGEPEECDPGDITKRPGRYELQRKGETFLWTDSAVDDRPDDTREKALARDIRGQGEFWAHHLARYEVLEEKWHKREDELQKKIDDLRAENARYDEKLAELVMEEGGDFDKWIPLVYEVTLRLLGNSWTNELHRRLNNCKKRLTKEEAELILRVINSEEFNQLPDPQALASASEGASEPPKLQ